MVAMGHEEIIHADMEKLTEDEGKGRVPIAWGLVERITQTRQLSKCLLQSLLVNVDGASASISVP